MHLAAFGALRKAECGWDQSMNKKVEACTDHGCVSLYSPSIAMYSHLIDSKVDAEARVSSGEPQGAAFKGDGRAVCLTGTLDISLGLIVSLSPFCLKGSAAMLSSSGP